MSSTPQNPKIIAVIGPTASGKTALATEIARQWNGEIVSADSRQIYRGMDIGTAKPSREEQREIPHHLIDIRDPDEDYTVAEYKEDTLAAMREIFKRKRLPVLVGGTGLYVRAILDNLDIPKIKADPKLRERIEEEIDNEGLPNVFKKLIALDPDAEFMIDGKNPRRVVRAMEVAIATGRPFTAQQKKGRPLFDALRIGITIPKEELDRRIDERVDRMICSGLADETALLLKTFGAGAPALDAIGYREMIAFLEHRTTLEEGAAAIKKNTRQYAKRQMTWFKKDPLVKWADSPSAAMKHIADFLGKKIADDQIRSSAE